MSTITTPECTQICFQDCGTGQPVMFSHGWPLSPDWQAQMMFLASSVDADAFLTYATDFG